MPSNQAALSALEGDKAMIGALTTAGDKKFAGGQLA
jgi:hypothetical protein